MRIDVGLRGDDLRAVGGEAASYERLGADGLWSVETAHDPFLPLFAAALATRRVSLGTAIAVAFARTPFALAQTAWDLQRASGGRLRLGLGTQVRAHVLSVRANDLFWASDLEAARAEGLVARRLASAVGDREGVLEIDLLLARIDIADGRCQTGLSDGLRAAREARDAGYEGVGVTGYRNLAIMAARIMDAPTAEAAIREGLEYADAIEQSHCRQMMSTTTAVLDWAAGNWDAADERGRQELVDRGCRRGVVGSLDVIGLVALGRGQTAEARRWLEESLLAGRHIGEVQFILTPLWGLAETELATGDVNAAVERCEEGWRIASAAQERALFIPFVVTGARSLIAARRPDDAERWVARAREYLAAWEPIAAPALSHADGLVRMASGSMAAAREALERAVRGWEERGRTWETLGARLDLAPCVLRLNRHADVATLLDAVRVKALEIGSPPFSARAAELEKLSHGRGVDAEAWRPLTVREFEVARLIASGLTNAQIAAELVVSPKTVSAHVEHILAKLGVARRTEIATWATTVRGAGAPVTSTGLSTAGTG